MPDRKLTISEGRLAEILELRFTQFEAKLAKQFISEKRAREIVRDESATVVRQRWDLRSKMAAVLMFLVSASTFVFTILHDWGHALKPR